jgi:hypothetical protein
MEISQLSPSTSSAKPAPRAGTATGVPAAADPAPAAQDSVEISNTAQEVAAKTSANPPSADPPSALKSLTYGTLGLESPAEAKKQTDGYYTAGRYLAAAATAGAFLSLLL